MSKRTTALLLILSFAAGAWLIPLLISKNVPEFKQVNETASRTTTEQETIDIYKQTNQAVVFISTVSVETDPFDWLPHAKQSKGSGSGVVISAKEGLIITNLHVIEQASKIEIYLADDLKYQAKLVGYDKGYDIAVLQLINPPADLVDVKFANSDQVEIGQRVLAIGNPYGLNRTLTTGIISSMDRNIRTADGRILSGLIQTDAAINPGNSGGPLLDSSGNLIGINTVILSSSGDSAGIGFAIPINRIKEVLPELISTGKISRPNFDWILIDTNQGPFVRRLIKGGVAEKAGLQAAERYIKRGFLTGVVRDFEHGDLIVEFNYRKVYRKSDIEEEILKIRDREAKIPIVVKRGGKYGQSYQYSLKPKWR